MKFLSIANPNRLLALVSLLVLPSLVMGSGFQDDFETYFDPGATRPNGGDSHADPNLWVPAGSDNWSSVTNNDTANDYLRCVVGGQASRSSIFFSKSEDLGFNNAIGTTYSVDVLSYHTDSVDQAGNLFGVMGEGDGWYYCDYAIAVEFTRGYIAIWKRDDPSYSGWGATETLYSANYSGTISGIEISLNDTDYAVTIDGGIAMWNVSGALEGQHGFSASELTYFDTAQLFLASTQGAVLVSPNLVSEWDNVSVTTAADASGSLNDNMWNLWLAGNVDDIEAAAISAMNSMQYDANMEGFWGDIDYANIASVNSHYTKIFAMAKAYQTEGMTTLSYKDANLKFAIEAALSYGQRNVMTVSGSGRPTKTGNWWYWEVAVPQYFGRSLYLLKDEIDSTIFQDGRDSLAWLIGTSVPATVGGTLNNVGVLATWTAERHVALALIDGDTALMADVTNAFANEANGRAFGVDGIQADYSFHTHADQLGPIVGTGGVGTNFLSDMSNYIGRYVDGTGLQLPQASLDNYASFLVDGVQHVVYNGYWDLISKGREVARGNQNKFYAVPGVSAISDVENSRQAELQELTEKPFGLVGHKHFWLSDHTTHHGKGWYASTRLLSDRVLSAELSDGDAYKQFNIANGSTWVVRDGGEYVTNDILAALDWSRLPGTTVEQKTHSEANYGYGDESFSGGCSTGLYGASAMKFSHSADTALTAKKSWFYFDEEVVCIGSDIDCSTSNTVETIVAQWPLSYEGEEVLVDGVQKPIADWSETLVDPTWIYCDGMGYYFPEAGSVYAERGFQSGSWSELKDGADTTVVERAFQTLLYDHGTNVTDASYVYAVVPDIIRPGWEDHTMADYAFGDPFEVVVSDNNVHAVKDRSSSAFGAVFWAVGSADIVEVDTPCVVSYHIAGGKFVLAVSEPTHSTASIQVTLNATLTNPSLPAGATSQVVGDDMVVTFAVEAGENYVAEFDTDIVTCGDVYSQGLNSISDFNQDCVVDLKDFLIMAQQWGEITEP